MKKYPQRRSRFQPRTSALFLSVDKPSTHVSALQPFFYSNGDTLKIHSKKKGLLVQTDELFLKSINRIKQQDDILDVIKQQLYETKLNKKQCEQLHYYARIHEKANIVNQNSSKPFTAINGNDQCLCGCEQGKGKLFSIFQNEQKLPFLGPGIILQFFLTKSMGKVLTLLFILFGIYSLITNAIGKNVINDSSCQNDLYCHFKITVSAENKINLSVIKQIQSWIGVFICLVWILAIRIIKYIGRRKNQIIDNKLCSPSDTTIKISNLPYGSYEEIELIDYINDFWKRKRLQIMEKQSTGTSLIKTEKDCLSLELLNFEFIHIIYDISCVEILVDKLLHLVTQLKTHLVTQNDATDKIQNRKYVKDRLSYLETKSNLIETFEVLSDVRKRFMNDINFRKKISSTSCLIKFRDEKDQRIFVESAGIERVGLQKKLKMWIQDYFKNDKQKILFQGKILQIERAPEPSDLIWQNCQKPFSPLRKLFIMLITFFVILGSFAVQLGLNYLSTYLIREYQSNISSLQTILNTVLSFILMIVNSILWTLMTYLLNMERNHTITQKVVSQMQKVIILSGINVIALPILTNIVTNKQQFIFGNTGLVGLSFDYQVSAIINIIKDLLNVMVILKGVGLLIGWIRHKIINYFVKKTITGQAKGDQKLNKFYEGQEYDIAANYVFVIVNILHAFFFCKLQPIILLICTISTLLFFYVQKIKLFRLCKIPGMTQYLVFDTALYMLSYGPILFATGSFLYYLAVDSSTSLVPIFVCYGVGILGITNPKDILNVICKLILRQFYAQSQEQKIYEPEQQAQEFSEESLNSVITKDNRNNRNQSYFDNSNLLSLFGFELKLKGENYQLIEKQLRQYCESFFENELSNKQNLNTLIKYAQVHQNIQTFTQNLAETSFKPQKKAKKLNPIKKRMEQLKQNQPVENSEQDSCKQLMKPQIKKQDI